MIIPGWLISIVTFPGVIVHELAHLLFCRLRRVPVLDVCFFRVGNPAGYVLHAPTEDFTTSFFVSVGPFIVNSVLCFLICLPVFIPVRLFGRPDPLDYLLLWLGVSIGMHAFPSTGDAGNLMREAKAKIGSLHPLAVISFPLVLAIWVANLLRFFWFDYIYGLAIGLGLPELILKRVV